MAPPIEITREEYIQKFGVDPFTGQAPDSGEMPYSPGKSAQPVEPSDSDIEYMLKAGFSPDEITQGITDTLKQGKPYNVPESAPMEALDVVNAVGSGMVPMNDQIVSGLSAVLKKPEGASTKEAYNMYLDSIRGSKEKFASEHPDANFLAEFAGGLASPTNKLIPKSLIPTGADGVLKTMGKNAAAGGALSALYALGGKPQEGESQIEHALNAGTTGALVGGALGLTSGLGRKGAKALPELADRAERSSIGVGKKELDLSLQTKGQTIGEEIPLEQSIRNVFQRGTFNNVKTEAQALAANTAAKKEIAFEIGGIIDQADKLKGAQRIYPKWENTDKFLSEVGATEAPEIIKLTNKLKKRIEDSLYNKGATFRALQDEKIALGKSVYGELQRKVPQSVQQKIFMDMKDTLEKRASSLIKDKTGQDIGKLLKDANTRYAEHASIERALQNRETAWKGKSMVGKAIDTFKTTGGTYAALTALSMGLTGNPIPGMLAGKAVGSLARPANTIKLAKVARLPKTGQTVLRLADAMDVIGRRAAVTTSNLK